MAGTDASARSAEHPWAASSVAADACRSASAQADAVHRAGPRRDLAPPVLSAATLSRSARASSDGPIQDAPAHRGPTTMRSPAGREGHITNQLIGGSPHEHEV